MEGRFVCREGSTADLLRGTWPVQVEISLSAGSSSVLTKVVANGSNFGFGPIQKNHLKGQMGNLRNRIELRASEGITVVPQSSESLTSEIERLAELHVQGILTDEEFRRAKERLLSE